MGDSAGTSQPQAVQVVVSLRVRPGMEQAYADIQGRLSAACQKSRGFLTHEVSKPREGLRGPWVVRASFDSEANLTLWLQSNIRTQLLAEAAPLLLEGHEERVVAAAPTTREGVTMVLQARPNPETESDYQEWQTGINNVAATYPGFQAARVFPPKPPDQPDWAVAYSFDTEQDLQRWLESPDRREWLERGKPLFEQTSENKLLGGFGAWFAANGAAVATPPAWKQVMTVLAVLYPTVMITGLLLVPLMARVLPQPVWMFLSNLVSVAFLQYAGMTLINRVLRFWLRPDPRTTGYAGALGFLAVLGIYAVSIAVFMVVG